MERLQGLLIAVIKYQIQLQCKIQTSEYCYFNNKMLHGQSNHLYRLSMVSSFVGLFSKLVSALHHTCKGSDFLHKRC